MAKLEGSGDSNFLCCMESCHAAPKNEDNAERNRVKNNESKKERERKLTIYVLLDPAMPELQPILMIFFLIAWFAFANLNWIFPLGVI